jgi:hypothetical protein
MDVARELLKATLTGITHGTVKLSLTQAALLEHAGLVRGGLLTALGQAIVRSA